MVDSLVPWHGTSSPHQLVIDPWVASKCKPGSAELELILRCWLPQSLYDTLTSDGLKPSASPLPTSQVVWSRHILTNVAATFRRIWVESLGAEL